ncbi:heavy metal translocating P-type ATPase, partial [Agathobaculum sp.]|uniref:heavy metal translocating P-type ATPase n=1 Tax=Agathobaculum sp. TaxID=2048138 RepID=UPI003AB5DF3E
DDACCCGHDHEHEHPHHHHDDEDDCCCGHDHEHEHHHHHHDDDDDCCCGHDHDHEHHHHHHEHAAGGHSVKRVYTLQNVGCAHCAAKMEERISQLDGVEDCVLVFETKQLRVTGENPDALLPKIREICSGIESEAKVIAPTPRHYGKNGQRVYTLENLGCAHCAAKMQHQISQLDGIDDCVLVYETKQLRVKGENPDALLPKIREICSNIESEVKVIAPEEEQEDEEGSHPLAEMLIGAALFVAGLVIPVTTVKIVLMVAAYLLLGRHVLLTAVKNIGRGQVFDENFLMAVATIGAWAVGSFDEAVGVMLFYRVGEYFEDRAVDRSRRQIMDAIDLRPETVNLVGADGSISVIPAEDAAEGDIVLVRPGDRVPLDGEVSEGETRLDTSAVTGEPVPVRVTVGDRVTSGCVNTDGAVKIRVTHVLAESMVQRILDSVENAAARKPKIDRFITRFSRVYTPAVVAIALLTAIVPSLFTGEWHKWVYTAMTFLVISCPCALVLSVPLTYFSGIGAGSRRGILFKGGASLEALNNVKTIVMDKTGTITKGNFVVQNIVPAKGVPLNEGELLWLAAKCESASTHPIARSILTAYEERGAEHGSGTVENIREQAGEGVIASLEGKTVLCGNVKLMEHSNIDLSGYHGTPGSTEVLLALDGRFLGHIDIADTVKPDAKQAIGRMKAQGLRTAMLTGDGQASADAVAQSVGIDEVHARLLPQDKLAALNEIREKNGAVMFVGDGINDAPVLAGADVGAAMGSGADAAIEAADVVFMKADLSSVPTSVKIARSADIVSKENIIFALAVKLLVMVLGLVGIASMWLAVFADTGVAMLCVLNSVRMLYKKID